MLLWVIEPLVPVHVQSPSVHSNLTAALEVGLKYGVIGNGSGQSPADVNCAFVLSIVITDPPNCCVK